MVDVEAVVRAALKDVRRRLDRDERPDLVEKAYRSAVEAREELNRHMGELQRRRERPGA